MTRDLLDVPGKPVSCCGEPVLVLRQGSLDVAVYLHFDDVVALYIMYLDGYSPLDQLRPQKSAFLAMDVAAAVVGFVGLAGQCLQGCKFLQNFFGNAYDAPQIIRGLLQELDLLITLLKDFCLLLTEIQTSRQIPDLTGTSSALSHCYDAIWKLRKFARKHVVFASANTRVRMRNALRKLQCA
jgi:hypothetical protein